MTMKLLGLGQSSVVFRPRPGLVDKTVPWAIDCCF